MLQDLNLNSAPATCIVNLHSIEFLRFFFQKYQRIDIFQNISRNRNLDSLSINTR